MTKKDGLEPITRARLLATIQECEQRLAVGPREFDQADKGEKVPRETRPWRRQRWTEDMRSFIAFSRAVAFGGFVRVTAQAKPEQFHFDPTRREL